MGDGEQSTEGMGGGSDPETITSGLADALAMFGSAEKADKTLGYLRRIADALETMNGVAARQSREWLNDYMNNVDATDTERDPVPKPRRRWRGADPNDETDYFA